MQVFHLQQTRHKQTPQASIALVKNSDWKPLTALASSVTLTN